MHAGAWHGHPGPGALLIKKSLTGSFFRAVIGTAHGDPAHAGHGRWGSAMIFECGNCGIRLRFDESKYEGRSLNITCPKCKTPSTLDLTGGAKRPRGDTAPKGGAPLAESTTEQGGGIMAEIQTMHQLLAVRMNWLRWLAKPIKAVWDFIVDSLRYLWEMVLLAWSAMKESLNYRYWIIAGIAGTAAFFLVGIFVLAGTIAGEQVLGVAGVVLSILVVAWLYAVIADVLNEKEQNGADIDPREIPGRLGRGFNAIALFCLYAVVIIAAAALQVALDFTGKVPVAGTVLIGIFLIPLVLCSAVIILSGVILVFGTPLLGAHLVKSPPEKQGFLKDFITLSVDLLKMIGKRWIDLLVVGIPATVCALLVSFLPMLLIYGSLGLSLGIMGGVTGLGSNPQALMGGFVAGGVVGYVSAFFFLVSLSVIFGAAVSFGWASISVTYYRLYSHETSAGIVKKLFALAVLLLLTSLLMSILGLGSLGALLGLVLK